MSATAAPARIAQLTDDGRALLIARIARIRDEELPAYRPLLVEWERDERIVAEFERLQAEHDRLEALLAAASSVPALPRSWSGDIRLGTRVEIRTPDGEVSTVRIVDPEEAFLDDERISCTSPLAASLLGARAGEVVEVSAPSGAWPCEVLEVSAGQAPASAASTKRAKARQSIGRARGRRA